MAKKAKESGIKVIRTVAQDLIIEDASFDFALLVTTIFFLNDIPKAFLEIGRILKPKGKIILAIIDKSSLLGKKYEDKIYLLSGYLPINTVAFQLRNYLPIIL